MYLLSHHVGLGQLHTSLESAAVKGHVKKQNVDSSKRPDFFIEVLDNIDWEALESRENAVGDMVD